MIATVTPKKTFQTFTPVQTPRASAGGNGHPRAPTHEQIARRAYDIYIAHDRSEGHSEMDWRQAEEELAHAAVTARHKSETQFGF